MIPILFWPLWLCRWRYFVPVPRIGGGWVIEERNEYDQTGVR
jgi:hypothetical protein